MDYSEFPLGCDDNRSPWTAAVRPWVVGFICNSHLLQRPQRPQPRNHLVLRTSVGNEEHDHHSLQLRILVEQVDCITKRRHLHRSKYACHNRGHKLTQDL
jgi:hypothetical protein